MTSRCLAETTAATWVLKSRGDATALGVSHRDCGCTMPTKLSDSLGVVECLKLMKAVIQFVEHALNLLLAALTPSILVLVAEAWLHVIYELCGLLVLTLILLFTHVLQRVFGALTGSVVQFQSQLVQDVFLFLIEIITHVLWHWQHMLQELVGWLALMEKTGVVAGFWVGLEHWSNVGDEVFGGV